MSIIHQQSENLQIQNLLPDQGVESELLCNLQHNMAMAL